MGTTKISSSLVKRPVSPEEITAKILLFRDKKVMLDSDLSKLYGVPTGLLNLAVKRNIDRFPSDFMFQLDEKEAETLILQIAIANKGRGGRRTLPYVFTEQGVAMLSSVLLNKTLPPLDNLFEVLQALDRLKKLSKPETKLDRFLDILLDNTFKSEIGDLGGGTRGFSDAQISYRDEFFNKRGLLPKENAYRRIFIEQYIDEEVYNRFYLEKEEEAGRYETEDEGHNYTPERAREWDEHYNALCKEYSEETYIRNYASPDEYYYNID